MDWWANIVGTLSLLLAISAFIWAIRTFGKSKPWLDLELSVREPVSPMKAFGSAGPFLVDLIKSLSPNGPEMIEQLSTEVIPALRKGAPAVIEGSPLLSKVWPSFAHMLVDTWSLAVAIRNQGANEVAVLAVEIGNGKRWIEIEDREVLGRMTDLLPAPLKSASDLAVWFPIEKVNAALDELGIAQVEAQVRVRTTPKATFAKSLAGLGFSAKSTEAAE
ncbi:MAG: hypothetical protein WDM88_03230 [Galbitalea sp.]